MCAYVVGMKRNIHQTELSIRASSLSCISISGDSQQVTGMRIMMWNRCTYGLNAFIEFKRLRYLDQRDVVIIAVSNPVVRMHDRLYTWKAGFFSVR